MKDYSTRRKPENVEWHQHYCYDTWTTDLPRLFLVGDSICNGNHRFVREEVAGRLTLSFLATSRCVTDARYVSDLKFFLESDSDSEPALIYFNNGLHSLVTDIDDYAAGYEDALAFLLEAYPQSRLVVAASTPLRPGDERNGKVDELNRVAREAAARHERPYHDLHAVAAPFSADAWGDPFHFSEEPRTILAKAVAEAVLSQLGLEGADGEAKAKALATGTETGPDGKL